MKATGEVMSIGRTVEESILKAIRSLETGQCHLHHKIFDNRDHDELIEYIKRGTDDRIFAIAELLKQGETVDVITKVTGIDKFFIRKFENIVKMETVVRANPGDIEVLRKAKKMGYSDKVLGVMWKMPEVEIFKLRKENGIFPVYKMIDTCASEFQSYIPYFYSTY